MRKCTKKWKMKDGQTIRVCDMTDSHLLNTIRLIERCAKAKYGLDLKSILSFPAPMGEQAQIAFAEAEDDFFENASWEDNLPSIYYDMVSEKEHRNLG